jgi:hypothetical protein
MERWSVDMRPEDLRFEEIAKFSWRGQRFILRFDLRDSLRVPHRAVWKWVQDGCLEFGEGVQVCRLIEERAWDFWSTFKIPEE